VFEVINDGYFTQGSWLGVVKSGRPLFSGSYLVDTNLEDIYYPEDWIKPVGTMIIKSIK
jgi:hypothetical protein